MRELLTSGIVLRMAKERKGLAPFPERPRIEDFEPTEQEKQNPAAKGHVWISVFDRSRTTSAQIFAIRRIAESSRPVFPLPVEGITAIQVEGRTTLYVARDPLQEPECFQPGADGHCGIGDLARRSGEPRAVIKDLCSQLVDAVLILNEISFSETASDE